MDFIKENEKWMFCHLKIEWLQNYGKTWAFIVTVEHLASCRHHSDIPVRNFQAQEFIPQILGYLHELCCLNP